jgi:hypothetical protein
LEPLRFAFGVVVVCTNCSWGFDNGVLLLGSSDPGFVLQFVVAEGGLALAINVVGELQVAAQLLGCVAPRLGREVAFGAL